MKLLSARPAERSFRAAKNRRRVPDLSGPAQYVPAAASSGRPWPSCGTEHRNAWQECETGLLGIGTVPEFRDWAHARSFSARRGKLSLGLLTLLDDATIAIASIVRRIARNRDFASPLLHHDGGVEPRIWRCADPSARRRSRMGHAPDTAIQFWEGEENELAPGSHSWRCGGHFPGGTVLHWRDGAGGRALSSPATFFR
jgi:hypothetical protein